MTRNVTQNEIIGPLFRPVSGRVCWGKPYLYDFILEATKAGSENIVQWWLEAIQKEGSRCKKGKYKLRTYTKSMC